LEVTREIVDSDLYAAEVEANKRAAGVEAAKHEAKGKSTKDAAEVKAAKEETDRLVLGDLWHLETAPMAALTLYFNEKIPGIPKEHVNLYGSPLKTSFIDISQHWDSLRDKEQTVLDVISSAFVSLQGLPPDEMAELIIKDVLDWLQLDRLAVQSYSLHANVHKQLFLNTVGSWHFRPSTKTQIPNLYIAGDYCRSQADLTTMESAVESGINTACKLLRDLKRPANIKPLPLDYLPLVKIWFWKIILWPLAYGIFPFRIGCKLVVAPLVATKIVGSHLRRLLFRRLAIVG
jgi:hypothetical protein